MVALKGRVVVAVRPRIEQKVAARPASRKWGIVVIYRERVEKFANVVGVVASFLEPDWYLLVVIAAIDPLRVASIRRGKFCDLEG